MKHSPLTILSLLWLTPLAWSSEAVIKPYRYADLPVNEETVLPEPMDTTGLSDDLSDMLQSYYKNTFGGAENWQKVESLLIKGKLLTPEGESYEFVNYRKKPDLNKTVVYLENKHKIVTCFDGNDAWQFMTLNREWLSQCLQINQLILYEILGWVVTYSILCCLASL